MWYFQVHAATCSSLMHVNYVPSETHAFQNCILSLWRRQTDQENDFFVYRFSRDGNHCERQTNMHDVTTRCLRLLRMLGCRHQGNSQQQAWSEIRSCGWEYSIKDSWMRKRIVHPETRFGQGDAAQFWRFDFDHTLRKSTLHLVQKKDKWHSRKKCWQHFEPRSKYMPRVTSQFLESSW